MSEWLPIETVPRDGTTVDLFNMLKGDRDTNCYYIEYNGRGLWTDGELLCNDELDKTKCNYTHWMPLPAPPKKEEDA